VVSPGTGNWGTCPLEFANAHKFCSHSNYGCAYLSAELAQSYTVKVTRVQKIIVTRVSQIVLTVTKIAPTVPQVALTLSQIALTVPQIALTVSQVAIKVPAIALIVPQIAPTVQKLS